MYKKDRRTKEGDNKEGWPTNIKTKTLMESKLQSEVSERTLNIHDINFIFEAQAYIRKGGKTGAETGMHDDRVIALGITLMILEDHKKVMHRPKRRAHGTKHFKTRSR